MKDKVAVVTGGSSGLGEAAVRAFVERGAAVCIADLQDELGEKLAAEIRDDGGRAIAVRVDVSDETDVSAMIDATVGEFGRLDFAFNNAGTLEDRAQAADIPVAQWQRVLNVNLTGVFLCLRAEVPAMLESGGGAIVNTASMAGLHGYAAWRMGAYAASKAGVIGLTRVAARDYAGQNIRVNAVCPGAFDTPMLRGTLSENPEWAEEMAEAKPMGRFGRPEELGRTVAWLCSDDASYISGDAIEVDGACYT